MCVDDCVDRFSFKVTQLFTRGLRAFLTSTRIFVAVWGVIALGGAQRILQVKVRIQWFTQVETVTIAVDAIVVKICLDIPVIGLSGDEISNFGNRSGLALKWSWVTNIFTDVFDLFDQNNDLVSGDTATFAAGVLYAGSG